MGNLKLHNSCYIFIKKRPEIHQERYKEDLQK